MKDKNRIGLPKGRIILVVVSISAILISGIFVSWWKIHRADMLMREDFLQKARLIAQAIDVDCVKNLSGTEADLALPEYLRLKKDLMALRTAFSECRFLYIMGRRDDERVFFYVDSEQAGSVDESLPGQIFEEATPEDLSVFEYRTERVVGPSTDRWGTWVSSLVPLTVSQEDTTIVFGMDIDAMEWKKAAVGEGPMPYDQVQY